MSKWGRELWAQLGRDERAARRSRRERVRERNRQREARRARSAGTPRRRRSKKSMAAAWLRSQPVVATLVVE